MSVSTPIFTLICCACAVPQASAAANAASPIVFLNICFLRCFYVARLNTEIVVQLLDIRLQLGIGELVDDTSVFHDVVAIRNGRCEAEILFDEQDGKTLLLERADSLADLLDDDRREPFGRLVEQEQPRPGAQDARDREHLLLAAGELRALAGAEALLQIREQREYLVEREPARPHLRRQEQVLLNAEAGEDAALLRAEGDAGARNAIRRQAYELAALEAHRSGAIADDAHDRLERGRLAGAVAPEQRHDLAFTHVEIDAVEDMGLAVPGFELVDRKQRRRAFKHGPLPYRPRARPDCSTPSRNRPRPGRGRASAR